MIARGRALQAAHERLLLAVLLRSDVARDLRSLAPSVRLSWANTRAALERLEAAGAVVRVQLDGGDAWRLPKISSPIR